MARRKPSDDPDLAHIAADLRHLAVPVDSLVEDPENARLHPERNLDAIMRSLAEFGQDQPLVARKDTRIVVKGNGRLACARRLGWRYVAALLVDESDARAAARAIADNRSGDLAKWDEAVLARLIRRVKDSNEVPVESTGFTVQQASAILAASRPAVASGGGGDTFTVQAGQDAARTILGDLWAIRGNGLEHRLLVADATQPDSLKRLSAGRAVHVVISDPPYGVAHDTDYTRFSPGAAMTGQLVQKDWRESIHGDDKPFDPAFLLGYRRVVLFGGNCYSDRLPCGAWLVWVKKREQNLGQFMSDAEVAWMNHGHGVYLWFHEWDGFTKDSERNIRRVHPTQKPVALFERLIEWAGVSAGETFLDPYLGSGTAIIAAHRTGRCCVGCEIVPRFADAILQRAEAEGMTCSKVQ